MRTFLIRIPNRTLNELLGQPIDQTQRNVKEQILGTIVRSSTKIKGYTSVQTIPSRDRAIIQLNSQGNLTVNSISKSSGVVSRSDGRGNFQSASRLALDSGGMKYTRPKLWLDIQSCIRDVCANSQIKERIATRKIAESKSKADEIGKRRAQKRMESAFTQQTYESAKDFNSTFEQWMDQLQDQGIDRNVIATEYGRGFHAGCCSAW